MQTLTFPDPECVSGLAEVRLPYALQDHCGGRAVVQVPAGTVGEALASLVARFPALRRHLYADNGELRGYVNVFLNEDEARTLPDGMATALRADDVLMIIPSIAGG